MLVMRLTMMIFVDEDAADYGDDGGVDDCIAVVVVSDVDVVDLASVVTGWEIMVCGNTGTRIVVACTTLTGLVVNPVHLPINGGN